MYKIIGADGKEYGPVTAEQLREWRRQGRVDEHTRILPEGSTDWLLFNQAPEFATPPTAAMTPPRIGSPNFQSRGGISPRTNGFAVAGLVIGFISIFFGFCCCGGVPLNVLGLTFSAIGWSQIKQHPEQYSGAGLAIAGLIISGLSLLLGVGVFILGTVLNWNEISRELQKL